MDESRFLVAHLLYTAPWKGSTSWVAQDAPPYEQYDPIDVPTTLLESMFSLYRDTYRRVDRSLNVPSPLAFFDFSRWILLHDHEDRMQAFILLRTTTAGLKVGIVASTRQRAVASALKCLLRQILNIDGVYAEVSDRMEQVLIDFVPIIQCEFASQLVSKPARPTGDGYHYERQITNVGPRTKLLVGRPFI